jgi:hypothetical protein
MNWNFDTIYVAQRDTRRVEKTVSRPNMFKWRLGKKGMRELYKNDNDWEFSRIVEDTNYGFMKFTES